MVSKQTRFRNSLFGLVLLLNFPLIWGSSCGWMTPDNCNTDKPVLGLSFVHMRKAGGTYILSAFKKWMVTRGCAPASTVKHGVYGTYGVKHGVPILLDPEQEAQFPELCPYVDFSNNEYSCVDGSGIPRHPLLNRTGRKEHFSILTTLRDPIERIGSQAFYRNGPAQDTLVTLTREMCGRVGGYRKKCQTNPDPPICGCINKAQEATKVKLRANDDIWLSWINKSYSDPNNFMGDNYAANYYIRRLAKEPIARKNEKPARLFQCLNRVRSDCDSSLPALHATAHKVHCVIAPKGQPEAPLDLDYGLGVAKNLFKNHFDFIITEHMTSPYAVRVMQKALHDPTYSPPASRVNAGAMAQKVSSYRDYMSPAVIEYMENDNWYDIELYKYALDLFLQRSKEEI